MSGKKAMVIMHEKTKKNYFLCWVDELAEKMITDSGIDGGLEFRMAKETEDELKIMACDVFRARYEADTREEKYFVDISFVNTDTDEGEGEAAGLIYKRKADGEYMPFDFETVSFVHNESFSMVCTEMEKSIAVDELLDSTAWRGGFFPQQLPPGDLLRLILKSKGLIDLREYMGDCAFLSVIEPEGLHPPYELDDLIPAITSDNGCIWGNAILEEDGIYHLYQYVSRADVCEYYFTNDIETDGEVGEYRRSVFSTSGKEQIQCAAMFMWSVPDDGEDRYIFPLSESAKIIASAIDGPYFVHKTPGRDNDLTKKEADRMNDLITAIKKIIKK